MKNREERVTVLFTPEEREELAKASESVGLKLSTYVRFAALAKARADNPRGVQLGRRRKPSPETDE